MKGNDQNYMPDTRTKSPAIGMYGLPENNYSNKNSGYPSGERMTFSQPDYSRLNMGGGMQFGNNMNQNLYEMDYKPSSYAPSQPQSFAMPDYSHVLDTNSMFIPQSKYLQEELKNNYAKDFGNNSYMPKTHHRPTTIEPSSYQGLNIPQSQPQKFDMKPEMPK